MEEIIAKFEAVMQEYNAAYTAAETADEQKAVNEKYESIIAKAEKQMEADAEKHIAAEEEKLKAEQQASAAEMLDPYEGKTAEQIAKTYSKPENIKKLRQLGGDPYNEDGDYKLEIEIAHAIVKLLKDA